MKKIIEIFKGEHGSFARYAIILAFILFLILLLKPGNNLINWVRAEIEISRQEKLIRSYKEEMRMIDERVNSMKHDKDTLEKFAREQFLLAAPGEDVFILEKD